MDENLKDDGTRGDWNGISIVIPSYLGEVFLIYFCFHLLVYLPDRCNDIFKEMIERVRDL